jgi:hypothetical protein
MDKIAYWQQLSNPRHKHLSCEIPRSVLYHIYFTYVETSGSKFESFCSGLDKESVLLGYDTASTDMWFPMCPDKVVGPGLIWPLKMRPLPCLEILGTRYTVTQCPCPRSLNTSAFVRFLYMPSEVRFQNFTIQITSYKVQMQETSNIWL